MNEQRVIETYEAEVVRAPKGMITETAAVITIVTSKGQVVVNMTRDVFEEFLDELPRRRSASSARITQ